MGVAAALRPSRVTRARAGCRTRLLALPHESITALTQLVGLALIVVGSVSCSAGSGGSSTGVGSARSCRVPRAPFARPPCRLWLSRPSWPSPTAAVLAPSRRRRDLPSADPDGAGCNGFVGLCDLRLDQVALAGTHNSMSSSAEPGWYLAEQRLPISGQLAARRTDPDARRLPRVRAGDGVRTDLRAPHTADAAADDLDEEGQQPRSRHSG